MSKIRISCKICKKDFLPKNLERHISTVHEGNNAYKCHLCTHSLSTKNFLKTHLQVFHKNENAPVEIELAAMFTGLEKPAESGHVKNVVGGKIKKTSKTKTNKARVAVNTGKAKARLDKNKNMVNHGKRTRSNFKIDSKKILNDRPLKKRKKMDSDSSVDKTSILKALPIENPEVKPKSNSKSTNAVPETTQSEPVVLESSDVPEDTNIVEKVISSLIISDCDQEKNQDLCPTLNMEKCEKEPLTSATPEVTSISDYEKPFSCAICRKSFALGKSLTDHLENHQKQPKKIFPNLTICKQESINLEISDATAKTSRKCLSRPAAANDVIAKKNEDKISSSAKVIKRKNNNQELKSSNNKDTKEKIFTCHICEKHFNDRKNMKRHIRGVHEGKKPFVCTFEECEEAYAQKINLQRHLSSFHEKIKEFKCGKCPADFVRKEDLNKHNKKCK